MLIKVVALVGRSLGDFPPFGLLAFVTQIPATPVPRLALRPGWAQQRGALLWGHCPRR